jgi:hypothetical protein
MLELKSNGSGSISFHPFTYDEDQGAPWKRPEGKGERDIKSNQVREILQGVGTAGVLGGFVLNFRERKTKTR